MIGHGRISIPPQSSGAVEAIISDCQFYCEKFGHEVLVVNNLSPAQSMTESEAFRPDIVHLHDESKIDAFAVLDAPIKIVTTHDPEFFEKPNPFIERFVRGDFLVGCLCKRYADEFVKVGVAPDRILMTTNGARSDLICYDVDAWYEDRMICMGMIGYRKRQHLLFHFPFIDFVGPVSIYDSPPFPTLISYLGEWPKDGYTKDSVYDSLCNYAALVLISKSEAAPLVVMEALMAGLDVVVSEAAAANLDRSQPFVHVLDEKTVNNPMLLRLALERTLKAPKDRAAVRQYAEQHHSWEPLVQRYLASLFGILRRKPA